MAINLESQYPGKIAPATSDYPYGSARNITLPGDGTGTPWEAALVNDLFGFQQSLLSEAGIVPTGTPEKVGASQYLETLKRLFSPQVYATVAALKTGTPIAGGTSDFDYMAANRLRVETKWNNSTSKRGGGVYEIMTAARAGTEGYTIDDIVHHDLDGTNVAILLGDTISLYQAGAIGDFSNDDTNNIQAALDQFTRVFVPPGTFRITSTLNYNQNQFMFGCGESSIIKLGTGINTNMFFPGITLGTIGSPSSNSLDNAEFHNFVLDHGIVNDGDFVESVMTIVAVGVRRLRVVGMRFIDPSGDCIYLSTTYGGQATTVLPYDVLITDSKFYGKNYNRNAISIITGAQIRITDNHFYQITRPEMPCPIDLEPNVTSETIRNVVISGNTFDGCKGGVSLFITSTSATDFNSISNVTISDNAFFNPLNVVPYVSKSQFSIAVYNGLNVTVTGNVLQNPYSVGIGIAKSSHVVCSGNTILTPGEIGIDILDIFNSKVDNNIITMGNDTFNGNTCYGIKADTQGFVVGDNHTFERGSLENNVVTQTATPVSSIGISLEGNAINLSISGECSGFATGLYVGNRVDAYPSKLKVDCELSENTTPIASFDTGFTPDNHEWRCGEGVTFGRSSFSASATKVLTNLHVFPTSQIRVTRIGATGLANNITAESPTKGQITVTSEASESGEFVWEIISP